MNQLLPNKLDAKSLQKAWDLDQRALFSKNKQAQKKLWADALSICKKLLRKYEKQSPGNLQIFSKIVLIYLHQNKFTLARKYLNLAKKKTKNDPIILFNYGNLHRALDKPTLAIKYYEKAIKYSNNKIFKEELKKYKKILKKDKKFL